MFDKYFKRELRSTLFVEREDAEHFIEELSKMRCKWNEDYKEIVTETHPYLGTRYIVWTYIPEAKFRKAKDRTFAKIEL